MFWNSHGCPLKLTTTLFSHTPNNNLKCVSFCHFSCVFMFLTRKRKAAAGHRPAASPALPLQSRSKETRYGGLKSPHKPYRSVKPERSRGKAKYTVNAASCRFLYLAEFGWRTRWTQNYQSPVSWRWGRLKRACLHPDGAKWWGSSCPHSPGELPWLGCQ